MKCLIFGGTGLLGKRLAEELSKHYEVIVSSPSSTNPVFFGDGHSVKNLISKFHPNFIINCSAFADVDGCETDPAKAYNLNALGVKEISESIVNVDNNIRLIHISTDHFYDDQMPSSEESISPHNIYAYSKLLGEYYISNNNFVVLRTNFFGKSLSNKKSFTDWVYENISTKKELNLFTDIIFNPLSILTIEKLLLEILKSDKTGIYNFGSSSYLSKYEFAYKFCSALGLDTSLLSKALSPSGSKFTKRPKSMIMSVSKFEESFGIILPTLEDEIRLTSQEYKP
jgi:dTDP-4-dehydrorhamnose reductase